ncbi:MAG TPA: cytochrome c oxidase subunit II [Verrucomicrobiae bacterium]|nr:cytochrome c oxidase subunit II [Verrucomicrobiae bacterium]
MAAAWVALPRLHPPAASTIAQGVDRLYFFLTLITLFFTALIFFTIFYFMIRYRRRSEDEIAGGPHEHLPLELTWTIIPTIICVVIFVWASFLYVRNSRPPRASMEIFVIGKQWMWQVEHPEGVREINELHVPVNTPVRVIMTSQDVIHDFYIPAFRVKKDVLPGRYTSLWFEATETGTFHLYCGQYCGTDHSKMIGWVYVMNPTDYATWLAGGTETESMSQAGEKLFLQYGCATCHLADGTGRGPSLVGLFGKSEKLQNGQSKIVDETLLRNAISVPNSVELPSYAPIMPSFQGQINEEQLLQLISYIKSLGSEERKTSGK